VAVEPRYFLLNVEVSVEEFQRAIRKVNRAFNRLNRAYKRTQDAFNGPDPLCIDGHEYRRRQRRRVKRGR
jgi:hypothetical protein